MRTAGVIAAALGLIVWRFVRAWRAAWAADAADWVRYESRTHSTEYSD